MERPTTSLSRHPLAAVAVIMALGAALRFWRIDYQSVWLDEAISALLARQPFWEMVSGAGLDVGNPPLFHILLWTWCRIFGGGDVAIRALSAVIGVVSLPVIYWLGKKLLGVPAGLTAAALLAFSPFHIYYSQEARTYALAVLLSLLSTCALVLSLEKPDSLTRWCAYVLASFLGLFSHYFVGCVLAAQNLYVLWTYRNERRLLARWVAAQAGIGVLYLVWLPSLLQQFRLEGNLSRYADSWARHLAATPMAFSVGRTLVWKGNAPAAGIVVAGLGTVAFGIAFVAGLVEMRKRGVKERSLLWLTAAMPLLLPALVSASLFPMYSVQYAIPALPAWYLIVAAGLGGMSRRWRGLTSVVIAAAVAIAIVYQASHVYKHDWKRCVPAVERSMAGADIVVFDAEQNERAWARYARLPNARYRLYLMLHQGPDTVMAVPPGRSDVQDVSGAVNASDRVWVVLADAGVGTNGYYERYFRQRRNCRAEAAYQGIDVMLCVRR